MFGLSSLRGLFFSNENQKGSGVGGSGVLGGLDTVEEGENVIRTYSIRRESYSNEGKTGKIKSDMLPQFLL